MHRLRRRRRRFMCFQYFKFLLIIDLAEHGEDEHAHYSADPDGHFTKRTEDVDKIEHFDDSGSESDNGEFITIKVTNIEGNTETEEVDRIKEHHRPSRYVILSV